MNPLPESPTLDGFDFRLIQRTGDVALFGKRKPNHHPESFEVVLIQSHPAETICGRQYPAREAMPPSEAWGTRGWSYSTLEDAQRKFRTLVECRRKATLQPSDMPASAFSPGGSVSVAKAKP